MVFRLMDTEMVINEVRNRECLWNPRNLFYKRKFEKFMAWEEVAEVVVPKYKTCSEEEKKKIIRAVQSRWKTARGSYMKGRCKDPKKSKYTQFRQNTYVYKDKLTFLDQQDDTDFNSGRSEHEDGSNNFIENSISRSAAEVSEDDTACKEVMDYDIDIHDDFKDKIRDLIAENTALENVNDKAVNDVNDQDCLTGRKGGEDYLSGIKDQEDLLATATTVNQPRKRPRMRPRKIKSKMSEFEFKLLKILRSKNNLNSSALKADDRLFFESLAPFIKNFDTRQQVQFRSKILDLVKDIGRMGPVIVKHEPETI